MKTYAYRKRIFIAAVFALRVWDWHACATLLKTDKQWTLGYTCLFQIWFPRCVCPGVGNKELLYSTQHYVNNLKGKGSWKRMDICICTTESLCCMPEINTLLINYILIENVKWKKKKVASITINRWIYEQIRVLPYNRILLNHKKINYWYRLQRGWSLNTC